MKVIDSDDHEEIGGCYIKRAIRHMFRIRGFTDIAFSVPVPGNNCELIIIVIMV